MHKWVNNSTVMDSVNDPASLHIQELVVYQYYDNDILYIHTKIFNAQHGQPCSSNQRRGARTLLLIKRRRERIDDECRTSVVKSSTGQSENSHTDMDMDATILAGTPNAATVMAISVNVDGGAVSIMANVNLTHKCDFNDTLLCRPFFATCLLIRPPVR